MLAAHPFRLNDSAAECGLSTGASGGIESRDVFFGGPLLNARPSAGSGSSVSGCDQSLLGNARSTGGIITLYFRAIVSLFCVVLYFIYKRIQLTAHHSTNGRKCFVAFFNKSPCC